MIAKKNLTADAHARLVYNLNVKTRDFEKLKEQADAAAEAALQFRMYRREYTLRDLFFARDVDTHRRVLKERRSRYDRRSIVE